MGASIKKKVIEVSDLDPNYEITYLESRGYDSPARWYEVCFKGERIGLSRTTGYGSASDALKFARQHISEQHEVQRTHKFAVSIAMMATRSNA